jgi:hypothetical protein
MNLTLDWTAIAAIATAISAIGAAWTLREMRAIAQGSFEDGFDMQYRDLAFVIPVDALIGDTVAEDMKVKTRECIYNYLDLSSEQAFMRMNGRIRRATWNSWSLGMKSHLKKPEFKKVWDEVFAAAPDTFTYLAKLIEDDFATDPKSWNSLKK